MEVGSIQHAMSKGWDCEESISKTKWLWLRTNKLGLLIVDYYAKKLSVIS